MWRQRKEREKVERRKREAELAERARQMDNLPRIEDMIREAQLQLS